MVIFLSHFLALLVKVESAEGQQTVLGGILVAVNVLLSLAVLLATWFSTQQTVDEHLTFEVRGAASTSSMS